MGESARRGTFEERRQFSQEAHAARQWLLDNPAPKSQSNHFLPLSDEPYLDLTDELYARLVNLGKFKNLTKSNFDYLRSQSIFYDTQTDTFSTKRDLNTQNNAYYDTRDTLKNNAIHSIARII